MTRDDRLRILLNLCDELATVREAFERGSEEAPQRLARQKSEVRRQLKKHLSLPDDRTPLLGLARKLGFEVDELTILFCLFHRRVSDVEYSMSGRELLWALSDSTYDLFVNTRHLTEEAPLVRSGAVTVLTQSDDEPHDILNLDYMMSQDLYEDIAQSTAGLRADAAVIEPYADNVDYFLDLHALGLAYQRRAAKIFEFGLWRELHDEPYEPVTVLNHRIEVLRDRIRRRVAATANVDRFDLRKLHTEFGLTTVELVVVTTLLAQEVIAGDAYVDVVDLIRLVSTSTRDLLRKRRLFEANGVLVAKELLEIEELQAGKSLTGHAMLANWVGEKVLEGNIRIDGAIASDERIEFHNYLTRLNDSDDFFEKLD